MKYTLLHRLTIALSALGIFFSAASIATADSVTLPQQYYYQGLTFQNSLTFVTPVPSPTPAPDITFTPQNKLTIALANVTNPIAGAVVQPTSTPQPTNIPSPTPTIFMGQATLQPVIGGTIVSSVDPSPTPLPSPTQAPLNYSPVGQSNPEGLDASVLFSMVNSYRKSEGLPAFIQDAKTCSLAQLRAPEVAGEVASGTMHSGLKALNLPYWNTENIIQMNSNQGAFNWWINDPIHRDAIVGNFTYSCVACSGDDCAEEFTSYVAK